MPHSKPGEYKNLRESRASRRRGPDVSRVLWEQWQADPAKLIEHIRQLESAQRDNVASSSVRSRMLKKEIDQSIAVLNQLVSHWIKTHDIAQLDAVQQRLERDHNTEALTRLMRTVESCTTYAPLATPVQENATHNTLFLMPVICTTSEDDPDKLDELDLGFAQALCDCIGKYPGTQHAIPPLIDFRLVRPEDILGLDIFQVNRIATLYGDSQRAAWAAATTAVVKDLGPAELDITNPVLLNYLSVLNSFQSNRSHQPSKNSDARLGERTSLYLRFVLGSVVETKERDQAFNTNSVSERLAAQRETWLQKVNSLARDMALKNVDTELTFLPPMPYFEAIRAGCFQHSFFAFKSNLEIALTHSKINPKALFPYITQHHDDRNIVQLRVSFVSRLDGQLMFGLGLNLNGYNVQRAILELLRHLKDRDLPLSLVVQEYWPLHDDQGQLTQGFFCPSIEMQGEIYKRLAMPYMSHEMLNNTAPRTQLIH